MSDINFCNTKEQLNHLGEVVTGKVDGSPTGADIDTSTLPYTGQVRKTLPALEGEYEQSITNKEIEADAAIDSYRLLNKGPYASGITLESKFEYITYNGESYFATNPPYTTTATTPDADGNLFLGGYTTFENVANKIGNKNELSNSNFLTPSPDAITHPNSTPESYVAGTQIFSGVYAGDSGCTVTLIDGRVNCTSGDYQFKVPNTGGLERVPVFTSSVSDYDGIPRTTGVSHALVGNEYIVTVTPAAGDVFSVKLEQGSVATRHEVGSISVGNLSDYTDIVFNTVDEMINSDLIASLAYKRALVRTKSYRNRVPYYYAIGGAYYQILSVSDYDGVPDGEVVGGNLFGADHYVGGGSNYVARLIVNGAPEATQYGCFGDGATEDYLGLQKAIYQNDAVKMLNLPYLISTSLDITDRANGFRFICDHSGIANGGATLIGQTGERAIIDTAGTQRYIHGDLNLRSGTTNPSKLGLLLSRSNTSNFAQFNETGKCRIILASDPLAFGGMGTVGIYNYASEIFNTNGTYSIADTGFVFTNQNDWNVTSYKDLTGAPNSTSYCKFEGGTVFASNDEVGTPLYSRGGVAMEGMVYCNGAASVTVPTYGAEFYGINRAHNLTIFPEFSKHIAYVDTTMIGCDITFACQLNEDRFIQLGSGFSQIVDSEIKIKATASGSFTAPDYWIAGQSSDVISGLDLQTPSEPVVDFVVPTNINTNRINCTFKYPGMKITRSDILSTDSLTITDETTGFGRDITYGTSNPEGVVTKPAGSVRIVVVAGVGYIYIKETGSGNTGWAQVGTL